MDGYEQALALIHDRYSDYSKDKGKNNKSGSNYSVVNNTIYWNKKGKVNCNTKDTELGTNTIYIWGTYVIIFSAFNKILISISSNEKYVGNHDVPAKLITLQRMAAHDKLNWIYHVYYILNILLNTYYIPIQTTYYLPYSNTSQLLITTYQNNHNYILHTDTNTTEQT